MTVYSQETIFAPASGQGRAGICVIRVSGPAALDSLKALTDADSFEPRMAFHKKIKHPVSRETIDHALVLFFEGPHSFTGEDVAEYHIHGSIAIIDELCECLSGQDNHRFAEAGEFTRRAFENGKMDLTEAEAIADLVDAQTSLQKNQALRQMDGALKILYSDWAERLKKALAYIEADMEFPDEDDPDGALKSIMPKLEGIKEEIKVHLQDNNRGEKIREGIKVAIMGAPNAGKSSLLNILARRDAAIVSDLAGTTRDVIEVSLDIGGYPFIFYDTAGLREIIAEDPHSLIEAEGIKRAKDVADKADMSILLFDGTKNHADSETLALKNENSILSISKIDQGIQIKDVEADIQFSSKSGLGVEELIVALTSKAKSVYGASEEPVITRGRHRTNLYEAYECLSRALEAPMPELLAEDTRLAMRSIGRITGHVDVEDLLDVIFKDFCIGK